MTHSDMLHRLDKIFVRFIFMNHYCLRFSSLGIYKNVGFPLSAINFTMLLQSTATLITISINTFICFKYYTVEISFFLIKIQVKDFLLSNLI